MLPRREFLRPDGYIRRLSVLDVDSIIHLQALITGSLKDSYIYHPLSNDEVAMLISQQGFSLGAFNNDGKLIGYAAAYLPSNSQDNLGLDLGICGLELLQVAHLEVGLVHPLYRGQGWQRNLYQYLIQGIMEQGQYRYILSTVACNNYPALHNSQQLYLYIRGLREKYTNKLRYLLIRDLWGRVNINPSSIIRCRHSDIELQHRLVEQGYYGFDVEHDDDALLIYYGLGDLVFEEKE